MKLTVVIPTYQRCASVERALCALDKQTLSPAEYEVIVVVDGSTDGTQETLASYQPRYPLYVVWQKNRGRAAACNTGIRMARGDVIVLLDDDMEAQPELLHEHLRAHKIALNLAVVGAAPIQVPMHPSPSQEYVAAKFSEHLARVSAPQYVLKLRDVYSGNFSIRRETLLGVGAFDEEFQIYGNEDLELAVRLRQAGVTLLYHPDAVAQQTYAKKFAGLARDHIAKGKTSVQLVKKHPETYAQLRLAQAGEATWLWRAARGTLLTISRVLPNTPEMVIRAIEFAEANAALPLALVYPRVLDYFYWFGVAQMGVAKNRPPDIAVAGRTREASI